MYEEKDESFYVGLGRSHSERLLYIHSGSAVTRCACVCVRVGCRRVCCVPVCLSAGRACV